MIHNFCAVVRTSSSIAIIKNTFHDHSYGTNIIADWCRYTHNSIWFHHDLLLLCEDCHSLYLSVARSVFSHHTPSWPIWRKSIARNEWTLLVSPSFSVSLLSAGWSKSINGAAQHQSILCPLGRWEAAAVYVLVVLVVVFHRNCCLNVYSFTASAARFAVLIPLELACIIFLSCRDLCHDLSKNL